MLTSEIKRKFIFSHLNRISLNLLLLQPSSTLRPYIGSRRTRDYFNNTSNNSLLSNNYILSTNSPLESSITIESDPQNCLSNAETADVLHTQEKEQLPVKNFSYTNPEEKRQLHLREDQKTKEVLPSSSSSLFFLQNTHDITPISVYDHSSPSTSSFVTEQQHSYNPSRQYAQYSYRQSLNTEKENQFTVSEKREQANGEPQKQIEPSANSILNRNQNIDLTGIKEENNSLFSSGYSLIDTAEENNNKDNQSYLYTSTPVFPSFISHTQETSNKTISSLLSDKNNNKKTQALELDTTEYQPSILSTDCLTTNLQHKTDAYQLNGMSSSRYSSTLSSNRTKPYPFDQCVTDQGSKYVIQLRTDEYQENEFIIKPRYSFNQLIIDAKHRDEDNLGGYVHRELHKVFNIPKHIDLNQYTYSYNKETQELTIEMPYLQSSTAIHENQNSSSSPSVSPTPHTTETSIRSNVNDNRNNIGYILSTQPTHLSDHNCCNNSIGGFEFTTSNATFNSNTNSRISPIPESSIGSKKPFDFDVFHQSIFRPQIVGTTPDGNNNDRKLIMTLDLSDYQPEDIKVSVKDYELIVKAERKVETDTRKSRTSFFQSTNLPPQTDIEHVQSNYINGKLVIEAPYIDPKAIERKVIGTNTTNQGHNW